MEAATPLRPPSVRVAGERLLVDGLVVTDACAVRLAREKIEAGEDPAVALVDAIEIGARVLDREQTGVQAEHVRHELERATKATEAALAEQTARLTDGLAREVEATFGPENGHLARELRRHFADESSTAVQHRIGRLVEEHLRKGQQDFLSRFFAADGQNPLADFKRAQLAMLRQVSDQQVGGLRELEKRLAALQGEVMRLHAEREGEEQLALERERGTAKGRSYEEAVFEALDAIALAQGDDAEAVGDLKGATRKTGDVVVAVDGCRGPARGRIVFEAKDARLARPEARRQLDRAMQERGAEFAVLVVPGEAEVPANTVPLREMDGDKLVVTFDPEEGGALTLEVAYALARARVLMARGGSDRLDAGALAETVERTLAAMSDVRAVKNQLTGATTSIDRAREVLDAMAARVRGHLEDLERELAAAAAPEG
jgi:uncharacterized small protein (DUF1192 family)